MRHEEPFNLKWSHRANLIRMPASIVKERCGRRVPISYELRQILIELEQERLRSGHKDSSVHGNYVIVTDEMVMKQFRERGWLLLPSERKLTAVAGGVA